VDSAVLRDAARGERSALNALPRLPWSRSEVDWISGILSSSTVLIGADASAARLRSMAATGALRAYDVIHLATHARVDAARPARSALVFAQVGGSTSDGPGSDSDATVLTAEEIEREWDLRAELVTLSACETALGRSIYGEGVVGFAHTFFLRGAHSMLASLWPVSDEASALLMQRFYSNWLRGAAGEGMLKEMALQDAKLWLRRWRNPEGDQPYEHPYYWAAFVLSGH